jgi:hypothetical protein
MDTLTSGIRRGYAAISRRRWRLGGSHRRSTFPEPAHTHPHELLNTPARSNAVTHTPTRPYADSLSLTHAYKHTKTHMKASPVEGLDESVARLA